MLGDISAPRRPRASPDLPSSQNTLLSDILQLYILEPQFALVGTMSDLSDNLASVLHVISTLMVSPSPDDIRGAATRCNVALLDAMTSEDESIIVGCGNAV